MSYLLAFSIQSRIPNCHHATCTEATIIQVKYDLQSPTDQCSLSAVVLIDLGAAFNIIDLGAFRNPPIGLYGVSFIMFYLNFANSLQFDIFEASTFTFLRFVSLNTLAQSALSHFHFM